MKKRKIVKKIKVNQEDIDEGVECCPMRHPLSRALTRILGYEVLTYMGEDMAFPKDKQTNNGIYLPYKAVYWAKQFDEGKVVGPINFEITIMYLNPAK